MIHINPYDVGLDRNPANFVALTPLSFLARAAHVHPHRTARVYGRRRQSWAETHARCRRLAGALAARGAGPGTGACMLPNVPVMHRGRFGVPMTGAILNTLNTRPAAQAIPFMPRYGEAKVPLTDRECAAVVGRALAAPPAAVIEGCEAAGIAITHVYGLTQVYGPCAVCVKKPEWHGLPPAERARMNSRQGMPHPLRDEVTVPNPQTLRPVPADGETIGEIQKFVLRERVQSARAIA